MTLELVQNGTVTVIALAAAAMILWRVIAFLRPSRAHTGCSSCASRQGACAATGQSSPAAGEPVPVQVLRRSPHTSPQRSDVRL
ncbi:MAG: hypothetical protein A3H96_01870 [Acidobacteria bacterium RIFCSPLOWO2_02_FULL_67_36]|nr:MAG: hypothetical protein A3H96_01870 [Acidobacteria bacterium RIFCSPLOWO2_02_FULL_67_36]OFW22735.1 MAG: hypothetical protein A3G21_25945 [Acidobacteria bacterium RIFCSPLOWO2_12_FULL_66_21]